MISEKQLYLVATGGYEAVSKTGVVLRISDPLVQALAGEEWTLSSAHAKCPVCGNSATIVKKEDGNAAQCDVCGLRTAGQDSETKAWSAWDARV